MKEQKPRLGVAKKRIKQAKEEKSSALDLNGLNLTAIPGEVFELTGLHKLYLSGNQLTDWPRKIRVPIGEAWTGW